MSGQRAGLLTTAAIAVGFGVGAVASLLFTDPPGIIVFFAYAGVGSYLAYRRPDNTVGWLLVAAGWGLMFGSSRITATATELLTGRLDPVETLVTWANSWGWGLFFVALLALTIVFPSGRLPSGRERRASRIAIGAMLAMLAVVMFAPTVRVSSVGESPQDIPNPIAIAPDSAVWSILPAQEVVFASMFVVVAVSVAAMLLRFRSSTSLVRLQFRWLFAAIAVVVIGTIWWVVLTLVAGAHALAWLGVVVTYPTVPVAITIAVLRYRLFEIDRIVSRSLGYAVVTATLALVFVGGVIGLQALLAPLTRENTVAVAASTLLVAALFQPLRRRVQAVIDRRFDRAGYDARQTVDSFAATLRSEVDLDAIGEDLTAVVVRSLGPRSLRVWVRDPGTRA